MRKRGFTLVELIFGLVLLSVIAGLVAYGGSMVVTHSQQRAAELTLATARAEGHRVAARRDLAPGDASLLQFPATASLLADGMTVSGLDFVDGTSTGSDVVSVAVVDQSTAVYAVQAPGRCLVMADDLNDDARWAYSESGCDAATFDPSGQNWSKDPGSATQLGGIGG